MSIVNDIYKANFDIKEADLATEILKHKELTPLDLWLLPQYPFDVWRRTYDYPRILNSIYRRRPDFKEWMNDQGITEEFLLGGHLSDFFEHKPLADDLNKHLVRVTYKGMINLQSWHAYKANELFGEDVGVQYEYIKSYLSYYDWILQKKGFRFSFMDDLDRMLPNTEEEYVYVSTDVRMLKMGGMEPPRNAIQVMLRGKMLEFVNVSGLVLHGKYYYGTEGNLEFNHCAVDNLKCSELDIPHLSFENCSVRNMQIANSDVSSWLFATSTVSGKIIDSKLLSFRIFGGNFNPTFVNSQIDEWEVIHEGVQHQHDFEKTYRALSKAADDSANRTLAADYKIRELDFIRARKKGLEWFWMTLNKIYWGYGQKPFRLIKFSLAVIFALGLIYSFFPGSFTNNDAASKCYLVSLFNACYFSIVTFTTLGYGDLSPTGAIRILAAVEGLFGAITLGFLVAGLTKNS